MHCSLPTDESELVDGLPNFSSQQNLEETRSLNRRAVSSFKKMCQIFYLKFIFQFKKSNENILLFPKPDYKMDMSYKVQYKTSCCCHRLSSQLAVRLHFIIQICICQECSEPDSRIRIEKHIKMVSQIIIQDQKLKPSYWKAPII